MKKYLILLMMSVLFACNSQAGYVLKGVFKGAGDGSAILRMHSKGKLVICDTVKMKGGKFVFEGRPRVWDLPWLRWYRRGRSQFR